MSMYDVVREALRIKMSAGIQAAARFLKEHGVCAEDAIKIIGCRTGDA